MNLRRRAVTLMELLVAMFVGGLILIAVYTLFVQARREAEKPRAAIAIEDDSLAVVRWLERDLAETNLQTIRSYHPTFSGPNRIADPGVTFESARDTAADKFIMQDLPGADGVSLPGFGIGVWQKWVHYSLTPNTRVTETQHPLFGSLKRYEEAMPPGHSRAPESTASLPGTNVSASRSRVLSPNMAYPNATPPPYSVPPDQYGGLFVYWNDPTGNPHAFADNDAVGIERGEPVCVRLELRSQSTVTGKYSQVHLLLQIKPRN